MRMKERLVPNPAESRMCERGGKQMEQEYILTFSSFYKAAYAQDMLEEIGIRSTMKKLPTELIRSCGTGLYLRSSDIDGVADVLERRQIVPLVVFRVKREGRQKTYVRVR